MSLGFVRRAVLLHAVAVNVFLLRGAYYDDAQFAACVGIDWERRVLANVWMASL